LQIEKRQRGRPRKKGDIIEAWQFGRAAMVMCAYDEARGRGEKHSTAVQHAVDSVKQCNREMPVSQTEVKRILATWRPRGSRIILRFESKILTEEDIKRHCSIREQLAALQGKNGLKLEVPTNHEVTRSSTSLTIYFAEKPNYPRHNRKIPQE